MAQAEDKKFAQMSGGEKVVYVGKVIVLAAELAWEIREAFESMDVHVMFSKPFDVDQLRSAVEHLAA